MTAEYNKLKYRLWIGLVIIIIVMSGTWFLGRKYWKPNNSLSINRLDSCSNEAIKLINSKNGIALFTVIKDGKIEIKVNRVNEDFWIDISLDDKAANNPSLSNDGQRVAYFFNNGANNGIKILDFVTKKRYSLFAHKIKKEKPLDTTLIDFSESDICSWSPVVWSNDSIHIAFFVNDLTTMKNYAVITNIKDLSKPFYKKIEKDGFEQTHRQMLWLDEKMLLISRQFQGQLVLDTLSL
jgi:hypothetical protein